MKYPFVKMNLLQYIATYGELTGYSFMQYCKECGIPVSNGTIYPHLKELERCGLIQSEVDGKRKRYTLTEYGTDWIKNSTNASMPASLGRQFVKLYRGIDLTHWEQEEDIEKLLFLVKEIKEALKQYKNSLKDKKKKEDENEKGK